MILIGSINVNGLRNYKKRQNIFHWLQKKRYDIILLQETHCSDNSTELEWKRDWEGNSIWNNGTNLSKGVCILFRKKFEMQILSQETFENGRIIALKIKISHVNIQLINIYTPNNPSERKQFFLKLNDIIDENFEIILAGDFNCVLDYNIDRLPKGRCKDQGSDELNALMNTFSIEDIFRKRYPFKTSFSFSRCNSKSRIDFFLLSQFLNYDIKAIAIEHFPFSDHDINTLNIEFENIERGPGIWKMNLATIQSPLFKESLERLWPIWSNTAGEYDSLLTWWEIIKYQIKQLTVETSRTLNTSKMDIKKYEERLNEIKDSDRQIDTQEITALKQKIDEYYSKQLDAAKIRSRVKYFEEGEKSTKYFYNLEKKNINLKVWSKIKSKDGSYKTDIGSILQEQRHFYENLFKQRF